MSSNREMTVYGNEVTLGRGYYSHCQEIYAWLREEFGPCTDIKVDGIWGWNQMFGYTTIKFKHDADRNRFVYWVQTL